MLWRAVAATIGLTAAVVGFPARAGAAYEVGWWYKASGSVQVVADANHYWAELYDNQGTYLGRGFDLWLDWYCQLGTVTSGDNQGTPLRLRLQSPAGSGLACLPNNVGWADYWSTYYGWHTATGYSSGANVTNPWYVAETPIIVFPRDAATVEAHGTLIEVY